jgi:hypothetical protein
LIYEAHINFGNEVNYGRNDWVIRAADYSKLVEAIVVDCAGWAEDGSVPGSEEAVFRVD